MQHTSKKMLIAILCSVGFTTGCIGSTPVPTPLPTPQVPKHLSNLPKAGRIRCDEFPGTYALWELPGSGGVDDDSGRNQVNEGKRVGTAKSCENASLEKVAWSAQAQRFYVYVKTAQSEGWIWGTIVEADK